LEHLEAYKKHLRAENDTAKHISQSVKRIETIIAGCGFEHIRDVSLSALQNWLADQRSREIKPLSIRTGNYYARDCKSFLTWLVDDERITANPLARFSPLNAATDNGRKRRAIEHDDFVRLIGATLAAEPYRGMSGADRAALYTVAGYTGLRVSELASRSAESFDLAAGVVQVAASHSKRRREDSQPLPLELVHLLRAWLPGKTGKLWPGSWANDAAAMLKPDLAAAGIPYRDAAGKYFDFHSLRHQFVSNLARGVTQGRPIAGPA
jgi:site-specific recombinase XerC